MQLKPIESKFKTSGPFLHQRDAKGRIAELESRERELLAELRKAKSANATKAPQGDPSPAQSKANLASARRRRSSSAPTNSEKQAAAIVAEFEAMSPGPARSRFYKANRDILRP